LGRDIAELCPYRKIQRQYRLFHFVFGFILVLSVGACAAEQSVPKTNSLPAPSSEQTGEVFVIDVDPDLLVGALEDPRGLNIGEAVGVLAAAHVDTIDTQYVRKSVVFVLRGPFRPGTIVNIRHEMELLDGSDRKEWDYSYFVGEDTKTIPMIIVNSFRIKRPAKIAFEAIVDEKIVARRMIRSQ